MSSSEASCNDKVADTCVRTSANLMLHVFKIKFILVHMYIYFRSA
jgi:hypothetical protein